jgi:hypothetical protein
MRLVKMDDAVKQGGAAGGSDSTSGQESVTQSPATPPAVDDTVKLSLSSKERVKNGLVALSLANLCMINAWFPALYDADFGYFNKLRVNTSTLLALAAVELGIAFSVWWAMGIVRHHRSRGLRWIRNLGFAYLLLQALDFLRINLLSLPMDHLVGWMKAPAGILGAATVLGLAVWRRHNVIQVVGVALGLLSPLAFFVLSRIVLLLLGIEHLEQHVGEPALQPLRAIQPGQPRIVWIIFDGTDQRVTFDQHPADLRIPALDRLRRESLYATNAYAPADATLLSMPSLISGQRCAQADFKSASDLTLTLADTNRVVAWSQLPSVFDAARELGINSAVVGWYHPYDRVLSRSLSYCAWYSRPENEPVRAPTFFGSACRQIGSLFGKFYLRYRFIQTCKESMGDSLSVVTNSNYGLVMLHLAPPHRPGVYNRATGQFTIRPQSRVEGYFSNLVLANDWLAKLRAELEQSGQANRTWIIFSADHSWRASRMYDGKRDLRVPFLVKVPGINQGVTYAPEFSTVLTHDLILAILRGEIVGQPDLVSWLDTHRAVLSKPSEGVD